MPLSVGHHLEGGTLYVDLAGEIDLATRPLLADALDTAFERQDLTRVVVDLAAVGFMDCYGMSALIHGRAMADKRSLAFEVRNVSGVVLTVMQLTGVFEHLSGR